MDYYDEIIFEFSKYPMRCTGTTKDNYQCNRSTYLQRCKTHNHQPYTFYDYRYLKYSNKNLYSLLG
jgi:hypothetical protein